MYHFPVKRLDAPDAFDSRTIVRQWFLVKEKDNSPMGRVGKIYSIGQEDVKKSELDPARAKNSDGKTTGFSLKRVEETTRWLYHVLYKHIFIQTREAIRSDLTYRDYCSGGKHSLQ